MSDAAGVFYWLPMFLSGFWQFLNAVMLTPTVSLLGVFVGVALISILIRSLINKG